MENKRVYVVKTLEEAETALEIVKDEKIFGLDLEWKPQFDDEIYHPTAIIQLASFNVCIIFCMVHLKTLPKTLKDILLNWEVEKIGCGTINDRKRFLKDWKIIPQNYIDIGVIAKECGWHKCSLKFLAQNILNINLLKTETLSNWENIDLTESQISYAAQDAWTTRSLYTSYFKPWALQCNFCHRTFKTWGGRKKHQQQSKHHFIYRCVYCLKTFYESTECQNHIYKHFIRKNNFQTTQTTESNSTELIIKKL